MKNSAHFCLAVLALSAAVGVQAARPVEFTVGSEYYKETYREYEKDGSRLMQQKGNGLLMPASNTVLTIAMRQN